MKTTKGSGQTLIPSEKKTIYVEDMPEDKELLNSLNTNQEDLKREIKERNKPPVEYRSLTDQEKTAYAQVKKENELSPETLLFNFEREINPTKRIKIGEEIIRRMTRDQEEKVPNPDEVRSADFERRIKNIEDWLCKRGLEK
jgi:hypothetical protein